VRNGRLKTHLPVWSHTTSEVLAATSFIISTPHITQAPIRSLEHDAGGPVNYFAVQRHDATSHLVATKDCTATSSGTTLLTLASGGAKDADNNERAFIRAATANGSCREKECDVCWFAGMFSEEQRLHALGLLDEGYAIDDVALFVGCSTHSIERWKRALLATGSVWANPDLHNKHADAAVRNVDLVRAVKLLVEEEPAALLRDHVDLLVTLATHYPDVDHRYVSASTVYRVMRHLGYTRKRVERLFVERSEHDQRAFAVMLNAVPLRCLVSVDETHTDGGDVYRKHGRTMKGERCELLDRDPRTVPKTSTMMAVSMTMGVVWSQTVVLGTAQTADDWRLFLQCLDMRMNKYVPGLAWELQPDACVVLYDNAGIHNEAGDEYMQTNGMHHIRLPAYSPNLQPVEGVFAELKKHVRDLVYSNGRYLDKPMQLMAAAVGRLTMAQIAGQFQRVADKVAALLL